MSAGIPSAARTSGCCGPDCAGIRFLSRHPVALRAFTWLCRSAMADWAVGLWAWATVRRHRRRVIDYRALVDRAACVIPQPADASAQDSGCEFLSGLMQRSHMPGKVARFLQGLEGLDPHVRAGLLKTWFHTAVLNTTIRAAHVRHNRDQGAERVLPLDAMVAAFGRCNLVCRGCYARPELGPDGASPSRLAYVVDQLQRMHVYHVLLIGKGEPFHDEHSRQCLFDVVRRHPQLFFSVYSNGTTIGPSDIRRLQRLPNLIVLLSLDGPEEINDRRRGVGVFRQVTDAFRRMHAAGLLFGFISTVFAENYDAVLDPQFVGQLADFGCRVGYYSLFVTPDDAADCRGMMLSPTQREAYFRRFWKLDAQAPIPLIDIDGVEAHFGCRAKRGATVYVDAISGRVSPCIRAPLACAGGSLYVDCQPVCCNSAPIPARCGSTTLAAAQPLCDPASRNRLSEILESEPFRQYRADRHGLEVCEAFSRAEGSRVES